MIVSAPGMGYSDYDIYWQICTYVCIYRDVIVECDNSRMWECRFRWEPKILKSAQIPTKQNEDNIYVYYQIHYVLPCHHHSGSMATSKIGSLGHTVDFNVKLYVPGQLVSMWSHYCDKKEKKFVIRLQCNLHLITGYSYSMHLDIQLCI